MAASAHRQVMHDPALQDQSRRIPAGRGQSARSHRVDGRSVRLFNLRQKIAGSLSGEPFEVMDQMHLIVIAERVSNLGPGPFLRPGTTVECRLEPRDSRVQLRSDTDSLREPAFELAQAVPGSVGEIADANVTMSLQDLIPRFQNAIGVLTGAQHGQQEFVRNARTAVEGVAFTELLVERGNRRTDHGVRVVVMIGQLENGYREETEQSRGLKDDAE